MARHERYVTKKYAWLACEQTVPEEDADSYAKPTRTRGDPPAEPKASQRTTQEYLRGDQGPDQKEPKLCMTQSLSLVAA